MIVGLGGMGASALAECASRGAHVVGIERGARGHAFNASTGKSRIIRQAYYEHPDYVPLLLRAYDRWRDLEVKTGADLVSLCGLLMAGRDDSAVIAGSLAAARTHDIAVEALDANDVRKRFPQVRIADDEVGLFEPTGGFVRPEAAVEAMLDVAASHGAEMRFDTEMIEWSSDGLGVTVMLANGEAIHAQRLILTLGAWFAQSLAEIGIPLRVQRNVQCWFSPRTPEYAHGSFPVFLLDRAGLPAPLYGFPDEGNGVKAAFHGYGPFVEPDAVERRVTETDVAPVAGALEAWMPGAANTFLTGKVCMYALTPDEHFIVDTHPAHANVVLCGGFSGHGFKFASVIGEIAADLAITGETALPATFLGVKRLHA